MGVAFSMIAAYILSRSFVPAFSALLLKPHSHGEGHARHGSMATLFARWEAVIDRGIAAYVRLLDICLRNRVKTIVFSFLMLGVTLAVMTPILRRDFFPEVDAGAFEMYARGPTGLRIDRPPSQEGTSTEKMVAQIEDFIRETIPEHDLELFISELG